MRAAVAFEGPIERAIHRFKYERWEALAPALAGLLLDRLAVDPPPAHLVVPVPLHPHRERERGYNQSALLARELSRRLNLRSPPGRLIRTRQTPPQVGLDRVQRRANVADAFVWQGPNLDRQPILLVDDVATTGATLNACAGALRQSGSGAVMGLAVARAPIG
jgi:ComF family protein